MKHALGLSFVFIVATFGVMQLVPAGIAVKATPVTEGKRNPAIHPLLRRACMECHSDESKRQWYARIAPVSWIVASDIDRGRQAMNLSTLNDLASRNPRKVMALLATACVDIQNQRMPPSSYRWLHPEAAISDQEAQEFCRWTVEQTRRLKSTVRLKNLAQRKLN